MTDIAVVCSVPAICGRRCSRHRISRPHKSALTSRTPVKRKLPGERASRRLKDAFWHSTDLRYMLPNYSSSRPNFRGMSVLRRSLVIGQSACHDACFPNDVSSNVFCPGFMHAWCLLPETINFFWKSIRVCPQSGMVQAALYIMCCWISSYSGAKKTQEEFLNGSSKPKYAYIGCRRGTVVDTYKGYNISLQISILSASIIGFIQTATIAYYLLSNDKLSLPHRTFNIDPCIPRSLLPLDDFFVSITGSIPHRHLYTVSGWCRK